MELEELIKKRELLKDEAVPKCFIKCDDEYCTMEYNHCEIKEWPPLSRCVNCIYWFTNLEKLEDKGE